MMLQFPVSKAVCMGLFLFTIAVVFAGGFSVLLNYSNSTEFCTSCHSMRINLKEYQQSSHYRNVSGITATCADCHVPKQFFPMLLSKIVAVKDVYREIVGTIDTPEKFEARRWLMANRVWDQMKKDGSRTCRSCHDYQTMNLTEQDKRAAKKHQNALNKNQSCIECHSGIAHDEPLEPD